MIYELRRYTAAPGKADALHNRFRTLTLSVFARHNMEVVGFWSPKDPTPETGDLVYMMRFESVEAMKAAWASFRVDPVWVAGKAESERDGRLATKVVSDVLLPTDYSPLQ